MFFVVAFAVVSGVKEVLLVDGPWVVSHGVKRQQLISTEIAKQNKKIKLQLKSSWITDLLLCVTLKNPEEQGQATVRMKQEKHKKECSTKSQAANKKEQGLKWHLLSCVFKLPVLRLKVV